MSTYRIGSDKTGGASSCVDKVCELVEKGGHNVVNLGVDSNLEHKLGEGSSDDIGVFVINGMCLATWHSCYDNLIKSGKCKQVVFAIPWELFKGSSFNKTSDLTDNNKKLKCVNESWVPASYHNDDGKWTVAEAFQQYDGVDYVYGDTCEDVAQAILDGNFGGTGDGDESSTGDQGETQLMSGWESLCDLIKPYDGQAFLLVRGDTVIVKKIEVPQSSAIWAYEGVNVVDDSVTITDYSPEIYNTIEVLWGDKYQNTIELCFTRHKELYGERRTIVMANKIVSKDEYDAYQESQTGSESSESQSTTSSDTGDDGAVTPKWGVPVMDTHSTSTNYANSTIPKPPI